MRWFLERVWTRVLEREPKVRLRLVGNGSIDGGWDRYPNVDALGWVDNVGPEMATWALSIVPIFTGGGTRIKVAEAFSRRCPVVATTFGACGYGVRHGEEVLLADTNEDFADSVRRLLSSPQLGFALAERAWTRYRQEWTWEAQADRVEEVVRQILNQSPKSGTESH
jgi:glycosyltransferase involved in cell wall biosynthesis